MTIALTIVCLWLLMIVFIVLLWNRAKNETSKTKANKENRRSPW
jgi:hypothetical protein